MRQHKTVSAFILHDIALSLLFLINALYWLKIKRKNYVTSHGTNACHHAGRGRHEVLVRAAVGRGRSILGTYFHIQKVICICFTTLLGVGKTIMLFSNQ